MQIWKRDCNMTFNWIGVAAALATFFGVWIGHVTVRKVEYLSLIHI